MVTVQQLSKADMVNIRKVANQTTRDSGYTRAYYSYPAKFLAHLPRELIRRFSRSGDLVFDGYCGSGTTGLEAMLLDRRFVGYDINPFAILISRVKTSRLDPEELSNYRASLMHLRGAKQKAVLDDEDRMLLGWSLADEIEKLAWKVDRIKEDAFRDFFRLTLIHSVKIVGRRDFRGYAKRGAQATLGSFEEGQGGRGPSIMPLFAERTRKMIKENGTLPKQLMYHPIFVQASNHKSNLASGEADIIVTSPPYKDLDVEYMQLQIQRPWEHRSKRSEIIARVLDCEPIEKNLLCGGRSEAYWDNLLPSLREANRVLKDGGTAFWWIGFRGEADKENFQGCLEKTGFHVLDDVRVTLSDNRAASSRSTHHGRETGMLKNDYLFVTVKADV